MFFEGSEKKLEIIVAASAPNLRELDVSFWSALVNCAHAEILSQISNAYRVENIIEWCYALPMATAFIVIAWLFARTGLRLDPTVGIPPRP